MRGLIKYRVWNGKNFKILDRYSSWSWFFEYPRAGQYLQEFTGLFDKNKVDIYEGDIVKTNPKHESLYLARPEVCEYTQAEIKWLCQAWKVCQSKIGATYLGDYAFCECCPCGLEIIGNIFENPELL